MWCSRQLRATEPHDQPVARTPRGCLSSPAQGFKYTDEGEESCAHFDCLTYLRRDLGRRLQAISDYRHRLHDRAEDIERRDSAIEVTHAYGGSGEKKSVSVYMQNSIGEASVGCGRRNGAKERRTSGRRATCARRWFHCLHVGVTMWL
jgi:hypothetical protein